MMKERGSWYKHRDDGKVSNQCLMIGGGQSDYGKEVEEEQ